MTKLNMSAIVFPHQPQLMDRIKLELMDKPKVEWMGKDKLEQTQQAHKEILQRIQLP